MRLFTFIMAYKGGTYISQVRAPDILNAQNEWLKSKNAWEALNECERSSLIKNILEDDTPTAISDVANVWCFTALDDEKNLALINIVKTEEIHERARRIRTHAWH
jgi:hypothetical protein